MRVRAGMELEIEVELGVEGVGGRVGGRVRVEVVWGLG